MDIRHSFFHLYLHNIFVIIQLIQKEIHVRTKRKTKRLFFLVKKIRFFFLTSSPTQPRVFVFTHSIKRSAIVQNTLILPLVA
jgi:hypothetical protein